MTARTPNLKNMTFGYRCCMHAQSKKHVSGLFPVDVVEHGDRFEVHASLLGFKEEQVQLDMDGNLLRVSCDNNENHANSVPEDGASNSQARGTLA